jgi:hypothetical protein
VVPYAAQEAAQPRQVVPWANIGLITLNFLVFFYELSIAGQGSISSGSASPPSSAAPAEGSERGGRTYWRPGSRLTTSTGSTCCIRRMSASETTSVTSPAPSSTSSTRLTGIRRSRMGRGRLETRMRPLTGS